MKFETPKMNISLFAAENVVTDASGIATTTTYDAAKTSLTEAMGGTEDAASKIFTFTF